MQLIRFGNKGEERPGIILQGQRKDCSAFFKDWDRSFFQHNGLTDLKSLVASIGQDLPDIPNDARWAAPIARPGMIMCIGLNYADHAKEAGMEIPKAPILFMKASNTIAGPYDDVAIPRGSTKTDWEVELGLVIAKEASYLASPEEAAHYIAGYCIVHDISERAFQLEQGGQWVKGKSCPGFSPVGPYLVTKESLPQVSHLKMELSVNQKVMQDGNTSTMVFDPAYLVWYLSQYMTLEAGDLISTGTPPGVGLGMKPPVYLKAGDEVHLSIEGLGQQRQLFTVL